MRSAHVSTGSGKFQQAITIGPHRLTGDEPTEMGGDDAGPGPHELLLAALGACTSMTLKMYADRKAWPLKSVDVDCAGEKHADRFVIRRKITLHGELTAEQRERLLEIAGKCPVHRTLTGTVAIETS